MEKKHKWSFVHKIPIVIGQVIGIFSQNKKAVRRANECLQLCQFAFLEKMYFKSDSEQYKNAWKREQFYARNHDRFWRLAWRKKAFRHH